MSSYGFPAKKILVPTDLSRASQAALAYARLLHDQFGGEINVLHAQHFDPPPYFSSGQLEKLTRELKRAARGASDYVRRESSVTLGLEPKVIISECPAEDAILETAAELDIDLIIMGTHGRRGAARMWMGSVAERVLRLSKTPVLAVRQTNVPVRLAHVLSPVNLSAAGKVGLAYAAQIAQATGSHLTVLHAVEKDQPPPDCSLVPDTVRADCKLEEVVEHGSAAEVILTALQRRKPDWLVMGAGQKSSGFGDWFSSTVESVLRHAEVPILVVPSAA
jgi:universal stress protein A